MVIALVVAAILVRIVFGLGRDEEQLLHDGYGFYLNIARTFLDGHGLCNGVDGDCTARMPLYPLWLSVFLRAGSLYPGVAIAQSIVGGSLTWLTWHLGRQLFDRRVALLAAAGAAFNPYTVLHDTALQDTVFVNVLMVASLLLLLRAQQTNSTPTWMWAGVAMAAAVLTNARISAFVPCALAWAAFAGGRDYRSGARSAALVALPVLVLLGGWVARNWQLTGSPVLTTVAGEQLWYANNASTFSHFPIQSIDLSVDEFPTATRNTLGNFQGSEVARDRLARDWAIDYIAADPMRTVAAMASKIWIAASAQLSPARGSAVQLGYLIVFLPVHLLAMAGLWRSRRAWRTHSLTWLLLFAFALTTAVFWAHTSHKSYLDPVLFVYAAAAACAFRS